MHLTSKPLEALIFLVQQQGRVVSKDELLTAVWRDLAVTEGVLVQAVRQIRRALDDDKENPTFVQTVPREGYRFVGDVLVESAIDGPLTALPETPPSATRRPLHILAGLTALALVVAAWRLSISGREPHGRSPSAAAETPSRIVAMTAGGISAVKPVFSPDGKALIYVSDAPEAQGVLDLYFLPLNGGNPWRLTHQANVAGDLPAISADGREIVFSRYRTGEGGSRVPDLWRVSSFGGTPARYIPEASGAGFSPDGAWVAYTLNARRRMLVVSPVGRVEEQREVGTPGFTPRWSPDGRWLAYTTSYPEGGDGDLWIVSSSLAEKRMLTHGPQQMYGLTWSADSGSIIFASRIGNTYHLHRVSLSDGSMEPLTSGVGDYVSPTVSPDGKLLAFTHVRPVRDLIFARPADADEERALTHNEFHRWPRLSPSGRRIASVVQRSTADDYLHVTDVESQESRRASDVPAAYPSWLDEDRVAYLTLPRDGGVEIRQVSLRSGENATIARVAGTSAWLAVRPGAAEAAFVVTTGDQQRVVLRDLASGRESIVAEGPEFQGLRWREDGKFLAWSGSRVSAGPQTNGVSVVEPGRSEPRRVVADGHGPAWAADGSLFFLKYVGDRDEAGIWRMNPATSVESQVRRVPRVDYFDVAGAALVFARRTGRSQVFSMPLP